MISLYVKILVCQQYQQEKFNIAMVTNRNESHQNARNNFYFSVETNLLNTISWEQKIRHSSHSYNNQFDQEPYCGGSNRGRPIYWLPTDSTVLIYWLLQSLSVVAFCRDFVTISRLSKMERRAFSLTSSFLCCYPFIFCSVQQRNFCHRCIWMMFFLLCIIFFQQL